MENTEQVMILLTVYFCIFAAINFSLMKNLNWLFIFIPVFAIAQKPALSIEGSASNLYLNHTTAPKESFYSIGRLYNISPKEIAPYNKLVLENGLTIGQVIKIPLTELNFSQAIKSNPDEALVPVYYTVKNKETLAHISTVNNKVPVAQLKRWNKLKSDEAAENSTLIVGYLKVKKALSAFAKAAIAAPAKEKPMEVVEHALDKPTIPEDLKPVSNQPSVKVSEPKKEVKEIPVVPQQKTSMTGNEGFFKTLFNNQTAQKKLQEQTGTAGIFKSTSGWEDGKYYCLHNTASAGSIIKITANNKSVYAKVLDVMTDIKVNEGLVIRLSSAAVNALGISGNKFECELSF